MFQVDRSTGNLPNYILRFFKKSNDVSNIGYGYPLFVPVYPRGNSSFESTATDIQLGR